MNNEQLIIVSLSPFPFPSPLAPSLSAPSYSEYQHPSFVELLHAFVRQVL